MGSRRLTLLRRAGRDVCRHWSGRLPLATSFWIYGVGVDVLLALWLFALGAWTRDLATSQLRVLVVGRAVLLCGVSVWQWVGIWRASRRKRTHPLARILARICVIASMVHVMVSMVDVAEASRDPLFYERFELRLLGKGNEAEIRGPLASGVSDALAALLASHPEVRTLHLTSGGGLFNEGLRLANLVRERRLRVVVDSWCDSACTLVLLASEQRLMRRWAQIGFHRSRVFGGKDVIPRHDAMESALDSVGASEKFIRSVKTTASIDIWTPSPSRLLDEHIITEFAEPDQFTYCPPYDTPADARKSLVRDPVLAAIAELDPVRFQHLVDDQLSGPKRGATWTELQGPIEAVKAAFVHDARCHPALATARAMAVHQARAVAAIASRFPERCPVVFESHIEMTGLTQADLGKEYDQVLTQFILASMREPSREPSPEELAQARLALHAKLSAATLQTFEGWTPRKKAAPGPLCRALEEYYRAMATLEPEQLVRLMRVCPASP